MEVGKVRQTAGRAGGKLRAAKIATGPLAHCSPCSSPIISFTPIPFLFFCEINFVSQDRQVLDVEDGDDGGHEGVAGGNRESPK